METLSYGFKKPANPDTGDIFFAALEEDIQKLNDHTHNGVNSARIATTTQTATAESWLESGNEYRQVMTCPSGLEFSTCEIWVIREDGTRIYPKMEKITANTFYLYADDNSQDYSVNYR